MSSMINYRLSPNTTADEINSPRGGGLHGRKGYNEPAFASQQESTPPPSRHSTPSHRDGLFGRKGYNTPGTLSPANSRSPSPAAGTFHDGLSGRKGYNAEHPRIDIASHSRTRSISPAPSSNYSREGALSGRKGYNTSPHSRDKSPAPSSSYSHSNSHSYSRSPSPNPAAFLAASERGASTSGALRGRKGYNAPPMPIILSNETFHGGMRGRKGYNKEHERIAEMSETRRKSHVEGADVVGLGIRDGALSGRKGYNATLDSSRSRSRSPLPQ